MTPTLRHLRRAGHVHVINRMVVRATSTHGMHCTDKKTQQLCTGNIYWFTRDGILLKKRVCTHTAFFSSISFCQQKSGLPHYLSYFPPLHLHKFTQHKLMTHTYLYIFAAAPTQDYTTIVKSEGIPLHPPHNHHSTPVPRPNLPLSTHPGIQ